jgi:hypothetical protein
MLSLTKRPSNCGRGFSIVPTPAFTTNATPDADAHAAAATNTSFHANAAVRCVRMGPNGGMTVLGPSVVPPEVLPVVSF